MKEEGLFIFKQKRAGKNGKAFIMYKLRTMKKGSISNKAMVSNNKTDSRITSIGRFLRTTNLDELPQLVNIIKGEMSFVGPRPDPYYEYEYFSAKIKGWKKRFQIKPGLTGWAQVNGKSSLEPEEKLRYDLYYIKNKSLLFDIKIICKTFLLFFKKLIKIR